MAMHALVMLGDWPALGPRAAAWLREAEELGDRFACVVAGLYVGHARLADADLAGARQAAATARALWSADGVVDGFHFQHWLALGLEVADEGALDLDAAAGLGQGLAGLLCQEDPVPGSATLSAAWASGKASTPPSSPYRMVTMVSTMITRFSGRVRAMKARMGLITRCRRRR